MLSLDIFGMVINPTIGVFTIGVYISINGVMTNAEYGYAM